MRANLFFFLCVGFVGAVFTCSWLPIPFWVLASACPAACAMSVWLAARERNFAWAMIAGFVIAILRIALLPDVFSVSMPFLTWLAVRISMLSQSFGSVFGRIYPEPIASFAQGILTGSAGVRLDAGFMQALRTTSTLHLIAVSGYNVTLVASYGYKLFHWLTVPRKMIWMFVLASLAVFTAFVGAPSSAVRAGIMASLAVIAERFYRTGYGRNALAFAAAVMLFGQPSIAMDLGFQLSFLATVGIMGIAPIFSSVGRNQPEKSSEWRQMAVETLCAQALVMPVLISKSGIVSLLGLAANFIVLPLIPAAMAVSFAAGMGFLFWNALGRAIAFVSLPFFLFITHAITWFASLPFAAVNVAGISGIWIAAYYAIVVLLVFRKTNKVHA